MRVLNKKQKKKIDEWFDKNWKGAGSLSSSDDMPIELQDELERMNDHETIWQNINRYITDKAMENIHNNPTPNWLRQFFGEKMGQRTQKQMYYKAHTQSAELNKTFLSIVEQGLTKEELQQNIDKDPNLWNRYRDWLDKLPN